MLFLTALTFACCLAFCCCSVAVSASRPYRVRKVERTQWHEHHHMKMSRAPADFADIGDGDFEFDMWDEDQPIDFESVLYEDDAGSETPSDTGANGDDIRGDSDGDTDSSESPQMREWEERLQHAHQKHGHSYETIKDKRKKRRRALAVDIADKDEQNEFVIHIPTNERIANTLCVT